MAQPLLPPKAAGKHYGHSNVEERQTGMNRGTVLQGIKRTAEERTAGKAAKGKPKDRGVAQRRQESAAGEQCEPSHLDETEQEKTKGEPSKRRRRRKSQVGFRLSVCPPSEPHALTTVGGTQQARVARDSSKRHSRLSHDDEEELEPLGNTLLLTCLITDQSAGA